MVIRQPPLLSVGKHFWNLTCSDLPLNGAPEIGSENLAVMLKKGGQGWLWERQELQKFFGKNVVLAHRETGFGCDFILRSPGFGQFAKMTIGKEAKLIVIVKDDTAVAGHSKIFREQVSRKNIGGGKVFDRLPIIPPCSRDCVRLVFPEKKIERPKPTLDIAQGVEFVVTERAAPPDGPLTRRSKRGHVPGRRSAPPSDSQRCRAMSAIRRSSPC